MTRKKLTVLGVLGITYSLSTASAQRITRPTLSCTAAKVGTPNSSQPNCAGTNFTFPVIFKYPTGQRARSRLQNTNLHTGFALRRIRVAKVITLKQSIRTRLPLSLVLRLVSPARLPEPRGSLNNHLSKKTDHAPAQVLTIRQLIQTVLSHWFPETFQI